MYTAPSPKMAAEGDMKAVKQGSCDGVYGTTGARKNQSATTTIAKARYLRFMAEVQMARLDLRLLLRTA
jgi:hypothetical protein